MRNPLVISLALSEARTTLIAIPASAGPHTKLGVEMEFNGTASPHAFHTHGYRTDQLVTNAKGNGTSEALWVSGDHLLTDCGTGDVDVRQNPAEDVGEYASPVVAITFRVAAP